jgi:hypothetical protein
MCMFLDEILETTYPSPRTHPVSIPSLESDRMQLLIRNPQDLLSDALDLWPIYHDIRAKVSLGIAQEGPSSHRKE